jgi:hypothetical protein
MAKAIGRPSNKSKAEKYKKWHEESGFINNKPSTYGIKASPTYMDIPLRGVKTGLGEQPAIMIQAKEGYPEACKLIITHTSAFYSFTGFNLVRDYCLSYDITPQEGSVLIILSFQDMLFKESLKFWCMNNLAGSRNLAQLCKLGFVNAVKVPTGKNSYRKRNGYSLSTLGINFVMGYEAWFESKMDIIRTSLSTSNIMQQRTNAYAAARHKEEKLKAELWKLRILKKKDPK